MPELTHPHRSLCSLGALGVSELLREHIRSGRYPEGRLPDEPSLTRDLGISRTRLRAALHILADEGTLHRRRGQGTFATDAPLAYEVGRQGFQRTLADGELHVEHQLLSATTWVMDPLTASLFGTAPGIAMHMIERRTRLEGRTLAHASYVVRGDLAPDLLAPELADAGLDLRDWFASGSGVPLTGMDITVEAASADGSLAELLDVSEGAPLVRMHRRFLAGGGELFAFGSSVFRSDRFAYRTHVPLYPFPHDPAAIASDTSDLTCPSDPPIHQKGPTP